MIIRNKKSRTYHSKIGKTPTLESAAAAYNKTVLQAGADSSITMGSQFVSSIGVEPKLIGASFNKALQGKVSAPIEGTSAVYLIRVDGYGMKPADTEEQASQQVTNRKTACADKSTDGMKASANWPTSKTAAVNFSDLVTSL